MRQTLLDWLGTRAWEPLCNWRARRAATRTLRKFESNWVSIVIRIISKRELLLARGAIDTEGLQHRFEALLSILLQTGRGHLQHPARTVGDGFAIAIEAFSQHNGLQLRYRPVQNVVDQNITVLAIILNLLAGLREPAIELGLNNNTLGAAAIAKACAQNFGVGRQNEDAYSLRHFGPHLRAALDIDIQQQIVAGRAGLV